ncbi:MAG TPA: hypothetical protein VNT99_09390 [Methylomirabilota bacterium]|nr:hypothetical protein [Methylomirabilota bacterium]
MKMLTLLLTALALAGTATNAADNKDRQTQRREQAQQRAMADDVDRRIQTINRLDNNQSALMAGMAAVSKETAVPLPTIEAEHKDHPQMGLAGLFVAHQLAVKSHKPVDQLIKQRRAGRTWTELARANNQDLVELEQKLARIEQAMRNPGAAGAGANASTDRTQVREAMPPQTELDKRIAALNALDDKPVLMRTGLQALSRETATPLPQLEELQKQQMTAGIGDLFVAQELAVRTHKSADELLKSRASGRTWAQIIAENNQDRIGIEQKLSRIEQAMRDADKQ